MRSGMVWWGGCWTYVIEGGGFCDCVDTIDETGNYTFQFYSPAIKTQLCRFSGRRRLRRIMKTDRCPGPNATLAGAHFSFRDAQKTCLIPSIPMGIQLINFNSNRCLSLHVLK